MKYRNCKDVFPEALLREIQKYASGQLVYIPAGDTKRSWGQTSGYKQYLAQRNEAIKSKFRAGAGVEQLADEFYLSLESIKKIVYTKKEEFMPEYCCTLASAKAFADCGRLEDWVHTYLLSDGHNEEFSRGLRLFPRRFLGPVKMPLSLFARCCGPEPHMKWLPSGQGLRPACPKCPHTFSSRSLVSSFCLADSGLSSSTSQASCWTLAGRRSPP